MAELESKKSIFLRSWLCCFPSRSKRTDFYFVKPESEFNKEECDYIVEKLGVKKVPVSLFEDYQHGNIPHFPSRSSSNDDFSEKCLAIYNLNSNSYDEIQKEDKISIENANSFSKKTSDKYLKKCNVIKMVKSKLKNSKKNVAKFSSSNNYFNKSEDPSTYNSNESLISNKIEKKKLKMDTFVCNCCIDEQISPIQKSSSSKIRCDQNTQTYVKYVTPLQDLINVTASTNTETSHTVVNKSVLTNGTTEPIKINLTLNTLKNNERNNQSKQVDTECQTENKSSILHLNDIINANDSLVDIKKNRTEYRNDIPEKENNKIIVPSLSFFKIKMNDKAFTELNSIENQNSSHYSYLSNINSSSFNINKNCPEDDQGFNFPERDIKSSNMTFDFQTDLNHSQSYTNDDSSIKETSGERDDVYSNTELQESDSQFTQTITLTENKSESIKQVPLASRNIQEIRNVNVSSNTPFCSNKNFKKLKSTCLKPVSPKLTEIQRSAELASTETNPIKWKIIIKQRKVPEKPNN